MFKRLLFGNEDKLHFRTSTTEGIARLYSEARIPTDDVQYWRSYLRLFDSANDVFTLLSIADVRKALIRHPENVTTLVSVLIAHLASLVDDPLFTTPPTQLPSGFANAKGKSPSGSATIDSIGRLGSQAGSSALSLVDAGARSAAVFGSLLGGAGTANDVAASTSSNPSASQRDRVKEALNCCRILTRVLPIIMEGDHDASCSAAADGASSDRQPALETDTFERQLLWSSSELAVHIFAASTLSTTTASRDQSAPPTSDADESQENQFVIEESDDEEDTSLATEQKAQFDPLGVKGGADSSRATAEADEGEGIAQINTPLGERLTRTIVDLLFYSGFTIPWSEEQLTLPVTTPVAASRVNRAIWEKGIGSSVDLEGRTKAHEAHRLEVLRLLLVLLSKSMFVPPNMQRHTDNEPLRLLATSLDRTTILPLLCSLINVSVVWIKGSNWLGGLASLPAGLVKDRLHAGGEDVRQATVATALQLLNVLLGYEAPVPEQEGDSIIDAAGETSTSSYSAPSTPRPSLTTLASTVSVHSVRSSGKEGQQNLFRLYLSKLHRLADFHVLADGIMAVLAQRPSAAQLLNPSAASQATDTSAAGPHIPDTMLLLWRLLWYNIKFRTFLLDDRAPQLLSHLLFHALNNKDSAARQGLVRLVVFILHDISCDRAFAVSVCKAGSGAKARITGGQRWGVAVGGGSTVAAGGVASSQASQASTGADILIQAVYALIATTKSALSALYPPLIITLTNASPYFKNLSILSANRLLALLTSFSNPAFLLADEGNPRVLFYHLESLNNIVQHGFQRNPNVAYAIVRNHAKIERLANFTLRRGIAEIRRSRRRGGRMGTVVTSPRGEQPPSSTDPAAGSDSDKPVDATQTPTMTTTTAAAAMPASEKARGKMRRSSTSSDTRGNTVTSSIAEDEEDELVNGFDEQELYFAASTVGRNGFVPTQAWVTSWHKGLPLDVLQVTVVELVPKVQELCSRIGSRSDADERVLALLREHSLDDVLPSVGAGEGDGARDRPVLSAQPRPFRWTPHVSIWLLSYLWGLVYVTNSLPYGLFNDSCARLFQLRTQDKGNAAPPPSANGNNGTTLATGSASPTARRSMSNDAAPRSPGGSDLSGSIAGVGNMVFGSLTSVLGLGVSPASPRPSNGGTREEWGGTV